MRVLPALLIAFAALAAPGTGAQEVPRFAPVAGFPPFVFVGDDGRVDGLSVDLLREVQQRAHLELRTLPPASLAEVLAAARRRDADVLAALHPTPERARYLLFTRPYANVPVVLVVRAGDNAGRSLADHAGQPVAVGAGHAVEPFMRARYPGVRWQPVASDALGLHGLAEGRFAAAVCDSASLAYITRRDRLQGLVAADHTGFEYTMAFAVRSDRPDLRDRLDEGLREIPAARRREIVEAWVPPELTAAASPGRGPRATLLALVLLGLAGVLALLAAWRRAAQR